MPVAVDLCHDENDMDVSKDQDATQSSDNPRRENPNTSPSADMPERIPDAVSGRQAD